MVARPKTIGILPIKGHSERVPEKNFRFLGNIPLWHYPIHALYESGAVDEIILDTDVPDEFLGKIPVGPVPVLLRKRPEDVCGDKVSMNLVLESIVRQHDADRYLQVHATSPFVNGATLSVVAQQMPADVPALYSVTAHFSRFWKPGNPPEPINHRASKLLPTQELEPLLQENSAFYLFRREPFLMLKTRTPPGSVPVSIPFREGLDIDTEEDWSFVRTVMAGLLAGG